MNSYIPNITHAETTKIELARQTAQFNELSKQVQLARDISGLEDCEAILNCAVLNAVHAGGEAGRFAEKEVLLERVGADYKNFRTYLRDEVSNTKLRIELKNLGVQQGWLFIEATAFLPNPKENGDNEKRVVKIQVRHSGLAGGFVDLGNEFYGNVLEAVCEALNAY